MLSTARQKVSCGGLNGNSLHRLIESDTIRGCDLVGRHVSLEVDFEASHVQAMPRGTLSSCCPQDLDVDLSATP